MIEGRSKEAGPLKITEKYFAATHPSRPESVDLLVENHGSLEDGGVMGFVVNGHWKGHFYEDHVIIDVGESVEKHPCKIVWQGDWPGGRRGGPGARDYNDAINVLNALLAERPRA